MRVWEYLMQCWMAELEQKHPELGLRCGGGPSRWVVLLYPSGDKYRFCGSMCLWAWLHSMKTGTPQHWEYAREST